ncbi:hypothetical protein VCHA53O463_60005 [Vibrio chagasii]|nr:hypothetical protein VCHA34P120_240077 [Vibrio chagasii]CAH7126372.1 hypothetical protein VCHA37P193_280076 [Vibrio chagasii]CAH7234862.1 hypothetical protein VCHA43P275_30225 [Vibrio chagasii]CAH7305570.1 hypothetical protein VCHA53O473_30079 [Vibrio chagasii]CAH7338936.1 hypothetical protein VCHA40P238_50074 [Vibrio chagasii]
MSHTIHLANRSNQPMQCIVMPNKDWAIADIASSAAMMAFSGTGIISTASDLVRIYKTVAMGSWSVDFAKGIAKLFEEDGIVVKPGEVESVYSTSMANPFAYLNPSKIGSLFHGVSDMTLLLRTADGKYTCTFNTNDDLSWIVENDSDGYVAVRAEYGHLWVSDPSDGKYEFDKVKINEEATA